MSEPGSKQWSRRKVSDEHMAARLLELPMLQFVSRRAVEIVTGGRRILFDQRHSSEMLEHEPVRILISTPQIRSHRRLTHMCRFSSLPDGSRQKRATRLLVSFQLKRSAEICYCRKGHNDLLISFLCDYSAKVCRSVCEDIIAITVPLSCSKVRAADEGSAQIPDLLLLVEPRRQQTAQQLLLNNVSQATTWKIRSCGLVLALADF